MNSPKASLYTTSKSSEIGKEDTQHGATKARTITSSSSYLTVCPNKGRPISLPRYYVPAYLYVIYYTAIDIEGDYTGKYLYFFLDESE